MQTHTELGTFDQILAGQTPQVLAIAVTLRDLIAQIHPDAVEVPRRGDRAISYGLGPAKMSEAYCYIMPQKDRVNLGFYHGVALDDPAGLLQGTGKRLRHVKIGAPQAAREAQVRNLIQSAMAERRRALDRSTT